MERAAEVVAGTAPDRVAALARLATTELHAAGGRPRRAAIHGPAAVQEDDPVEDVHFFWPAPTPFFITGAELFIDGGYIAH